MKTIRLFFFKVKTTFERKNIGEERPDGGGRAKNEANAPSGHRRRRFWRGDRRRVVLLSFLYSDILTDWTALRSSLLEMCTCWRSVSPPTVNMQNRRWEILASHWFFSYGCFLLLFMSITSLVRFRGWTSRCVRATISPPCSPLCLGWVLSLPLQTLVYAWPLKPIFIPSV